jgi:hypothetical protein
MQISPYEILALGNYDNKIFKPDHPLVNPDENFETMCAAQYNIGAKQYLWLDITLTPNIKDGVGCRPGLAGVNRSILVIF